MSIPDRRGEVGHSKLEFPSMKEYFVAFLVGKSHVYSSKNCAMQKSHLMAFGGFAHSGYYLSIMPCYV
jgi:hypothetical protein